MNNDWMKTYLSFWRLSALRNTTIMNRSTWRTRQIQMQTLIERFTVFHSIMKKKKISQRWGDILKKINNLYIIFNKRKLAFFLSSYNDQSICFCISTVMHFFSPQNQLMVKRGWIYSLAYWSSIFVYSSLYWHAVISPLRQPHLTSSPDRWTFPPDLNLSSYRI
jgi:hypothetical protein